MYKEQFVRTRIFLFVSLLISSIVQAGTDCGEPQTRYVDITCATELLDNANKDLDETYLSLLAKLDKDAKEKIEVEQQAWLQNRYAVKTFIYANASEGGSQRALIAVNGELDDTLAREKQLKEMLNFASK